MKRATYLKGFAATILTLINLIFAVLTFILLFRTVFYLGTFIGTAIRAFQLGDFSSVQKLLTDSITSSELAPYIEQITGGATVKYTFGLVHMIVSGVLLILSTVLFPVLNILNGIGSVTLRFSGKGSRMIQVVHVIYAIFNVLTMLLAVAVTVMICISPDVRSAFQSASSGNIAIVLGALIIFVVIFLLIQLMVFCYHKDIAQNMAFITSDVQGLTDYLDDNHLSGLAFFFGFVMLFPVAGGAYLLNKSYSLELVIAVVFVALVALKYFMVSASNRGLKKAVKARDRRNRR